jgi:hypothetical protein
MISSGLPENPLSKWKFFHVYLRWGTLGDALARNLTPDQALMGYVCPFLAGVPYPSSGGAIVNPRGYHTLEVYGTDVPLASDWPPLKSADRFDLEIVSYLREQHHSCSTEAFNAAVILIESGAYEDARKRVLSKIQPRMVFMISVLGDDEVDHIYHSVVKPCLAAHSFDVVRADEIRRAELITESITEAIATSRFVVADLTRARPNSYYELGYAHALGKPGVIIAKADSERHFDVAGYRWNHWNPGVDFGPEFDAVIAGVLEQLVGEGRVPPPGD